MEKLLHWRPFSIGSGARLETRNKIQGTRPFIGATDNANGVTSFVANDNSSKDKNVLGVNYDGAPGIAFYHPYECIFTDSVKRLHLKSRKDSKWTSLFFVTIFFVNVQNTGTDISSMRDECTVNS